MTVYCYIIEESSDDGWRPYQEIVYLVQPKDTRDFLNYMLWYVWSIKANLRVRRIIGDEVNHAITEFYIDSWENGGLVFNTRVPGV